MKRRWIAAGLAGGMVAFAWSFLSWMVFPWRDGLFERVGDEQALVETVGKQMPKRGIYLLPAPPRLREVPFAERKQAEETFLRRKLSGPGGFFVVNPAGMPSFGPALAIGFATHLLGAFLILLVLSLLKPMNVWSQAATSAMLGLLVGVLAHVPEWNWWGFPFAFVATEILDLVVGWFAAGLAMACLIPSKATNDSAR